MQRTMAAGLVAMALGVVTVDARADEGRWVMAEDGTWSPQPTVPADPPPAAVGPWSPPQGRGDAPRDERLQGDEHDDRRDHDVRGDDEPDDDDERDDEDPPMRSPAGFAGGIVLTAVGGSMLTGALLTSIPFGYEGSGGDLGTGGATVGVLGAAATLGGIGLILWARAPASGPSAALSVGPGDVRVSGSF